MKRIVIKRSNLHGRGVFAAEPIRKGERIQYINGVKTHRVVRGPDDSRRINHWIGIGRFTWINTVGTPFRYINHCCEPNAAIIGTKTVIALRDIETDEEITIDYSMTDADPHWSLTCRCGAATCRKHISAIETVPPNVFLKHMPHIPRYFQRVYIRNYIHKKLKRTS